VPVVDSIAPPSWPEILRPSLTCSLVGGLRGLLPQRFNQRRYHGVFLLLWKSRWPDLLDALELEVRKRQGKARIRF
jgi:hypothetical protein